MSEPTTKMQMFQVSKGEEYTHTSLKPPNIYNIPTEDYEKFLELYSNSFKQGLDLHLTEKQKEIGPVVIDFDFEQTENGRHYSYYFIECFLRNFTEKMKRYIHLPKEVCYYLLEKPQPRQVKNAIWKDGFHIIIPDVVIHYKIHLRIRDDILKECNENSIKPNRFITSNIDKIYDKNTIHQNNWFVYGSKKVDETHPYLLTKCFIFDSANTELKREVDLDGMKTEYIAKFSVRYNVQPECSLTDVGRNILHNQVANPKTLQLDTTNNTVEQLLKLIHKTRADDYHEWMVIGWALHNIDSKHNLDLWKVFSKSSTKYKEGECEKLWLKMKDDGYGMGTLHMYAKMDNEKGYCALIKDRLDGYIEKCLSGTHTDIARLIKELYKHRYVCASLKESLWYEFNDYKWIKVEKAYTLRKYISTQVFDIFDEQVNRYKQSAKNEELSENEQECCLKKAKHYLNIALKLKNAAFKESLIKECGELFYDANFLDKIDKQRHLLAFENGVYDLDNQCFRPTIAEDYITRTLGYDYPSSHRDGAIQQEIMDFVESIMANDKMTDYLLKVSAYMLHGEKYLEQLWFLTGSGRNGKGTYCTLLKNAFGDYYYEPDISIVTSIKRSSSSANPEMAKAIYTRLLVSGEPDDENKESRFRVSQLKKLRGNDMIQARSLYKEFTEFKPQFGMMFSMNEKPELSKVDEAIAKSLKIIPFPFQFVENPDYNNHQKKINTTLKTKFENNPLYRQEFIMILLDYYKRFIHGNKSIEEPIEVQKETEDYIKDNNPLIDWFEENCERDTQTKLEVSYLREKYINDRGESIKPKSFGMFMSLLGFKSKVISGKRYYVGINIKQKFLDD